MKKGKKVIGKKKAGGPQIQEQERTQSAQEYNQAPQLVEKSAPRVQEKIQSAQEYSQKAQLVQKSVPRVPVDQNENRYQIMRDQKLGAGGFGIVYKGFDNVDGFHVAVKETQLSVGSVAEEKLAEELKNEFRLVALLDHPNIVKMLDFQVKNGAGQLVMELMPGGSVADILRQTNFRLHERVIRRYTREALQGLSYLHEEKKIVHRDIKPGNMLLSGDGVLKLSDFGTSKQTLQTVSASSVHTVGTPSYLSKEAIMAGKYTHGSDMWALGCSIVEMATGKLPWSHLGLERQTPIQLIFAIGTASPPEHHPLIPSHLSRSLQDLVAQCFLVEIDDRPSARTLLLSDYFVSSNDDALPGDAETFESFANERSKHAAAVAAAGAAAGQTTTAATEEFFSDWTESSKFANTYNIQQETMEQQTMDAYAQEDEVEEENNMESDLFDDSEALEEE